MRCFSNVNSCMAIELATQTSSVPRLILPGRLAAASVGPAASIQAAASLVSAVAALGD
jgi:hypothetical protein